MSSPYVQFIIFSCLNAVLWWIHGSNIPRLDVFLTLLVALCVLLVRAMTPRPSQKMKVMQTARCKRLQPVVLLTEFILFLVVPWALLLATSRKNDWAAHILSTHLFYIQTQIALEFIVSDNGWRYQTYFQYIEVTTLLRGIGIARWISRYLEVRRDFELSYVTLLDIYTVLAIIVWLGANSFMVFVWYPCLTSVNDSGLGTGNVSQDKKGD